MKDTFKPNKNASRLCLCMEDLKDPFDNYHFDILRYSSEDHLKMRFIRKFFKMNHNYDALLISYFVRQKLMSNKSDGLEDLARKFRLNLEGCVRLNASLDLFTRDRLIYHNQNNLSEPEKEYKLSDTCLKAVLSYDNSLIHSKVKQNFIEFMEELDDFFERNEYFTDNLIDNLFDLITANLKISELKWLRDHKLPKLEEGIVLVAIRHRIFGRFEFNIQEIVKQLSSSKFLMSRLERAILDGSCPFILKNMVSFADGHFKSTIRMQLTPKVMECMCQSLEQVQPKTFAPSLFTVSAPATDNPLYIHDNPELRMVEKMVSGEHYEKIRKKVPRMTILLTGAPGVGKTSFVHHLARTSGRHLLSVNIASILSSYVGESEKNLVKLFGEAEAAYNYFEKTPIIVFDEAETLLYSRSAKSGNAVDQMNNNIISLLLASLDTFKGILICCSNFGFRNGSFDAALHRRFHLVAEIPAPGLQVLESILHHHFPELSEEECVRFLDKYDFITPAQIRNLRDKYEIQSLLEENGSMPETLENVASRDLSLFVEKARKKVGF